MLILLQFSTEILGIFNIFGLFFQVYWHCYIVSYCPLEKIKSDTLEKKEKESKLLVLTHSRKRKALKTAIVKIVNHMVNILSDMLL